MQVLILSDPHKHRYKDAALPQTIAVFLITQAQNAVKGVVEQTFF